MYSYLNLGAPVTIILGSTLATGSAVKDFAPVPVGVNKGLFIEAKLIGRDATGNRMFLARIFRVRRVAAGSVGMVGSLATVATDAIDAALLSAAVTASVVVSATDFLVRITNPASNAVAMDWSILLTIHEDQ